jgi:hypothetical protein
MKECVNPTGGKRFSRKRPASGKSASYVHPTGGKRFRRKRPASGKSASHVFNTPSLRQEIYSYHKPIICPMVLKLKTQNVMGAQQALTLYNPPPPFQTGAHLLWNDGDAGISTCCIKDLSYVEINKYIISLVKLIRDAADIIDREGEVNLSFSNMYIRIFNNRTLWALVIAKDDVRGGDLGQDGLIGGEIEGDNIVKTFVGRRTEESNIKPFFEKSWHSNGKGAAMGIFEIMSGSVPNLISKIKMDAIFGIKRY